MCILSIVRHYCCFLQDSGEDLRRMEQEQESFALQYHECTKLNGKYYLPHTYILPFYLILADSVFSNLMACFYRL